MAVTVTSAYVGEALDKMLVRATTGNEIVERGLIRVEPGIKESFYIPRLKVSNVLQKRKEQPDSENSKGDVKFDECVLKPREVMAYMEFNPRSFEKIWRPFQPTGELVFAELPDNVKGALLDELAKSASFELGQHIINGVYAEGADDTKLFDGILTRIKGSAETIKIAAPVAITTGSVIDTLKSIYSKIPKAIRGHKSLRFLMSVEDFDKYDDALSAQPNKGTAYTDTNAKRFKGVTIEAMAAWPSNAIVAIVAGNDLDSNLWMGVSEISDMSTVKVDLVSNAGEKYFFKMLMKVDTNVPFCDQVVLYDARTAE